MNSDIGMPIKLSYLPDLRLMRSHAVFSPVHCGGKSFMCISFLPVSYEIFLKKYSNSGFVSTHKTFLSFVADMVLTIILVATVQILTPINLRNAELLVLYCFCPLLITGLIVSLRLNGMIKERFCTIIFGIYAFLANYFVGLVYDVPADMAINLSDWATYTNGNVLLTVLVTCAAVGIILIGCGIKKSRK